jgi:ABC-type nitrate/sulfonate/bicarbonate transport system permease component
VAAAGGLGVSTATRIEPATRERPAPGLPRRLRDAALSDAGARITAYIVFLLGWQILGSLYDRVPGPIEVVQFLIDEVQRGSVWPAFSITVERFFAGVAIAFVAGVALGIVIGLSPLARALLKDTMVVGLAIPAIIWALLTALWFGFAWKAPVLTVALTATPFVAVNVTQGVQAVPRDLLRMAKAFGVPLHRRIRQLVLPFVMDYVFTGLRFGIITGWNGVLLSEWFASTEGVGWRTRYWYDANNFDGFVSWIVLFVGFIVIFDRLVLVPIQNRVFRWRTTVAAR